MKNFVFSKCGVLGALIPLTFIPQQARAMITIIVSASVELNFGTIDVSGAGTVTMDTSNGRSVTGGVTAIGGAGLESSGLLSVGGSTGLAIDLSMTAPAFNVSNGGDMMSVNNFDINGSGANAVVSLTSNPSTFPFGARLNVANGQTAGTYTGTFTVNASYQ